MLSSLGNRHVNFCARICLLMLVFVAMQQSRAQVPSAVSLLTRDQVESTFPSSVYFQGRTAPLQLRNAAAVRFDGNAMFFAGLVDSSGYASSVQERYQMYLLLEQPIRFGSATLAAGAYGAGFVKDHFVIMDLGGRTIAEGPIQVDQQMSRPRPLQMVQPVPSELRLYLGRQWVRIALQ